MSESQKRNLNPTAQALLAMFLFGEEYAAQRGGVMDFWDELPDHRKRLCTDAAKRIVEAPTVEAE